MNYKGEFERVQRESAKANAKQAQKRAKQQRERKAEAETKKKAKLNAGNGTATFILPSPKEPYTVAQAFLTEFATHHDGLLTLRFWRGDWMRWRGSHWRRLDARAVRRLLYRFLDLAVYINDDGERLPWSPTRYKITDVLDAMEAIALLDRDIEQPAWLDVDDPDVIMDHATDSIVSCDNCLVDVITGRTFEHTPSFFNLVAVPFAYDPQAHAPQRWLKFLQSLWPQPKATEGNAAPEIAPEINILAEWFGYIVSGRRDLHKMLLMVGPTRGGKGVIARTLEALIGKNNTCAPTLASLSGEYGLAPLIGKPLAIVSDARLSSSAGPTSIVVERLLSISGGDLQTINIKYRDQWSGHLPTRLHIVSNELPSFSDASSAIVGRFIIVMTTQSWLGKEDKELELEIAKELAGIFLWALAGLRRLAENDWRFTDNPHANATISAMHDLASPIRAFVREECKLGPQERVPRELLYSTYKLWATNSGHQVKNNAVFGRDLHAAFPTISDEHPRGESGKQYHAYRGITLRASDDA